MIQNQENFKKQSNWHFTIVENRVIENMNLSLQAKVLFMVLAKHANRETKECSLYMKQIAAEVGKSIRSVQYYMNELIEEKIISRTLRKSKSDPKMNIASIFTIILPEYSPSPENLAPGYESDSAQKKQDINFNYSITDIKFFKNLPEESYPLVKYFLEKTKRNPKTFNLKEIKGVCELMKIHSVERIKEIIDKAVERFLKLGKSLQQIYFGYIKSILKEQPPLNKTQQNEANLLIQQRLQEAERKKSAEELQDMYKKLQKLKEEGL